jgi:hypothetical protein
MISVNYFYRWKFESEKISLRLTAAKAPTHVGGSIHFGDFQV